MICSTKSKPQSSEQKHSIGCVGLRVTPAMAGAGRTERKEWHSWILWCLNEYPNTQAREWLVPDRDVACVGGRIV